jgi:hypothetical protein
MAIVWTLGALVLILAVREWIADTKSVQTVHASGS